jgi:hypothetical protein
MSKQRQDAVWTRGIIAAPGLNEMVGLSGFLAFCLFDAYPVLPDWS